MTKEKRKLEKCTRNELNEKLFNILAEKTNDNLESTTAGRSINRGIEEAAKTI
ncbi:hypothetical protein DZE39_005521 [Clostridium beijerinckii]|uniref:hypothetical protein n=1 Tax=Clostridium beijerinckii TaxID=1520 RepID=UPI001DC77DFB|nr:hypothetical protein [Clostridium beijerinckii]NRX73207.1 hypothetical protein [Clostridium beijerinckii]